MHHHFLQRLIRAVLFVVLLAGVVAVQPATPARAESWTPPVALTGGNNHAVFPDVVIDSAGVSHVVYNETPDFRTVNRVMYTNNRGGTWSQPIQLSSGNLLAEYARLSTMVVNGQNYVGVVYKGTTGGVVNSRIFFRLSPNGGRDWQGQEQVTNSPTYEPALALDDQGRPHVAFSLTNDNGASFHVGYATKNGGWSGVTVVSTGTGKYNNYPSIGFTRDGGTPIVHVLFMGATGGELTKTVYYTRKVGDGGFSGPQARQGSAGNFPKLVTDGVRKLFATWHSYSDPQSYEPYYSSSSDNGNSWSNPVPQGTMDPAVSARPGIARTPGGDVAIVWDDLHQTVDKKGEIYGRVGHGDGSTWDGVQAIFRAAGLSKEVEVGGGPSGFTSVWHDTTTTNIFRIFASGYATAYVPPPPPPPPPGPPPTDGSFADEAFRQVWTRTDLPVKEGAPGLEARTWIWGPGPATGGHWEPYAESPGGGRLVQYFEKSRMEINNFGAPRDQWFVTNGLLAYEMISGQIQVGGSAFTPYDGPDQAVAGDPIETNQGAPTYRSFRSVAFPTNPNRAPNRAGQPVTGVLRRDGSTYEDGGLGGYGVTYAAYDDVLGHNIPQVFTDFFAKQGVVSRDGGFPREQIIDWLYVVGRPLSEPYWASVNVGGQNRNVLMQAFERRVLTYTPDNAPEWRVEMGNVGLHYLKWRYLR